MHLRNGVVPLLFNNDITVDDITININNDIIYSFHHRRFHKQQDYDIGTNTSVNITCTTTTTFLQYHITTNITNIYFRTYTLNMIIGVNTTSLNPLHIQIHLLL